MRRAGVARVRHCLRWILPGLLLPFVAIAAPPGRPSVQPRATVAPGPQSAEKLIAGAVVGALAERFGGRGVEVRFGPIEQRPIDERRQSIEGEGSLRFVGDPGWIGFRFRSVYDTFFDQPGPPVLDVGVGGDARPIPNDSLALRQLEDHVASTLQVETGLHDVRMQLDRVETVETGQHYLGIEARGLADFGRDGSRDLRISALYDRRSAQWLQLDYELAADAPMPDPPSTTAQSVVAGR